MKKIFNEFKECITSVFETITSDNIFEIIIAWTAFIGVFICLPVLFILSIYIIICLIPYICIFLLFMLVTYIIPLLVKGILVLIHKIKNYEK